MRRWTKRILIVLAVFVLPVVAFYFYAAWQGDSELRAIIAELDASGEPWRVEDLERVRPPLADKDDIRFLMSRVRSQVPTTLAAKKSIGRIEDVLAGPPNVIIPPEGFALFDEDMQSIAAGLAEARKLADLPHTRLRIEWPADQLWPNVDDLLKVRELSVKLYWAAGWHGQLGDLDTAMDDCLAMLRSAQALQDEFTLTSQLVRMGMQAITLESLERVLAQGQPSPRQLARLQKAWEEFDTERALRQGFLGERAGSHRLYEALTAGKIKLHDVVRFTNEATFWENATDVYLRMNLKSAHAWTLRYLTDVLRALEMPEPQRAARWNELDQQARNAPGAARLLIGTHHGIYKGHRRIEARTRCAIAGLAAERFRHDQERWPKSLAELCPKFLDKIPDDPYAGKPLQFRRTGDGIVIYSVGPDGKQSGMNQENLAANRPGSISYEFRLWNVGRRRQLDGRQP